eukprot:931205-Rhodomonas_salina.2
MAGPEKDVLKKHAYITARKRAEMEAEQERERRKRIEEANQRRRERQRARGARGGKGMARLPRVSETTQVSLLRLISAMAYALARRCPVLTPRMLLPGAGQDHVVALPARRCAPPVSSATSLRAWY